MLTIKTIVNKEESENLETMIKSNYEEIYHENDKTLKNKVTNVMGKLFKIPESLLYQSIDLTNDDIEELFGDNPKFGTVGFEIVKDEKSIGYILLDISMDNKNISHGSIYSFYIKPEERKSFFQDEKSISELNNFIDNYFSKLGISNLRYDVPTSMWSEDFADAINKMGYTIKQAMNLDEIPFEKVLDLKKTEDIKIGK